MIVLSLLSALLLVGQDPAPGRTPVPNTQLPPDLSRAFEKKVAGVATVSCTVQLDGSLGDCTATEDPEGYNFGEAAIWQVYRMDRRYADIAPGTVINITIRFPYDSI